MISTNESSVLGLQGSSDQLKHTHPFPGHRGDDTRAGRRIGRPQHAHSRTQHPLFGSSGRSAQLTTAIQSIHTVLSSLLHASGRSRPLGESPGVSCRRCWPVGRALAASRQCGTACSALSRASFILTPARCCGRHPPRCNARCAVAREPCGLGNGGGCAGWRSRNARLGGVAAGGLALRVAACKRMRKRASVS